MSSIPPQGPGAVPPPAAPAPRTSRRPPAPDSRGRRRPSAPSRSSTPFKLFVMAPDQAWKLTRETGDYMRPAPLRRDHRVGRPRVSRGLGHGVRRRPHEDDSRPVRSAVRADSAAAAPSSPASSSARSSSRCGLFIGAAILHVSFMIVGALSNSKSQFEGTFRLLSLRERREHRERGPDPRRARRRPLADLPHRRRRPAAAQDDRRARRSSAFSCRRSSAASASESASSSRERRSRGPSAAERDARAGSSAFSGAARRSPAPRPPRSRPRSRRGCRRARSVAHRGSPARRAGARARSSRSRGSTSAPRSLESARGRSRESSSSPAGSSRSRRRSLGREVRCAAPDPAPARGARRRARRELDVPRRGGPLAASQDRGAAGPDARRTGIGVARGDGREERPTERALPGRQLDAEVRELLVRERGELRPEHLALEAVRGDGDDLRRAPDLADQLHRELVPRREPRVHAVVDRPRRPSLRGGGGSRPRRRPRTPERPCGRRTRSPCGPRGCPRTSGRSCSCRPGCRRGSRRAGRSAAARPARRSRRAASSRRRRCPDWAGPSRDRATSPCRRRRSRTRNEGTSRRWRRRPPRACARRTRSRRGPSSDPPRTPRRRRPSRSRPPAAGAFRRARAPARARVTSSAARVRAATSWPPRRSSRTRTLPSWPPAPVTRMRSGTGKG